MSASNFEELSRHVGHNVNVFMYGVLKNLRNVAIECQDCFEVIMDFDENDDTEESEDEEVG